MSQTFYKKAAASAAAASAPPACACKLPARPLLGAAVVAAADAELLVLLAVFEAELLPLVELESVVVVESVPVDVAVEEPVVEEPLAVEEPPEGSEEVPVAPETVKAGA